MYSRSFIMWIVFEMFLSALANISGLILLLSTLSDFVHPVTRC